MQRFLRELGGDAQCLAVNVGHGVGLDDEDAEEVRLSLLVRHALVAGNGVSELEDLGEWQEFTVGGILPAVVLGGFDGDRVREIFRQKVAKHVRKIVVDEVFHRVVAEWTGGLCRDTVRCFRTDRERW